jgi:hypothetical protein
MNETSIARAATPTVRSRRRFSTVLALSLLTGAVLVSTVAGPGPAAWAADPPKPGTPGSPAEVSTVTGTVQPLSAGRGYVDGDGGVPLDDWGDEGTIRSNGSYSHSNVAGLWQTILWADGLLSQSQIDCQFGPITAAATRTWQRTYMPGRPETGAADPATWARADDFIGNDPLGPEYFRYLGLGGRFIQLHRYGAGVSNPHRFDVNFFGEWRGSWYNSVTISFC